MAAIQVYKTDTFEIQRQKINQIGEAISNFSGGGNDFAAGNLKLGDGSILDPSLAFTSDPKLGFYKSFPQTLGIVSDNKKVVEFSSSKITNLIDSVVQQNSLLNAQTRVNSFGKEYDSGNYENVSIIGGSGTNATASFEVISYNGSVITDGVNYPEGNFTLINLSGGTGSGASCNFDVDGIEGNVSNTGSGYTFGAYENVPLTGGSGTGARADILVTIDQIVTTVIIVNDGIDYQNGDILSVNSADVGGTGSGFQYTITSNPGTPIDFSIASYGDGYSAGDILSVTDYGTTNLQYQISQIGQVKNFQFQNGGSGYIQGDILTVDSQDLAGVISYSVENKELHKITFVNNISPSVVPVGATVKYNNNIGFIQYVKSSGGIVQYIYTDRIGATPGILLTIETEGGENTYDVDQSIDIFRWFIDNNGIPNLTFVPNQTYRFNYIPDEAHIFSLSRFPGGIWGRSRIENLSTNLISSSNVISVSSSTGILPGMDVIFVSGEGQLVSGTKVSEINGNDVTLSKTPLLSGSAVLTFVGSEYTSNVSRDESSLTIRVTEDTPSPLYYYCATQSQDHADEGGEENQESIITIDYLNPRTLFGSEFEIEIAEIESVDFIKLDSITGGITSVSVSSENADFNTGDITILDSFLITSDELSISTITSSNLNEEIELTANNFIVDSNFRISNKLFINNLTGNLTSSGTIKGNDLNINDTINITNNTISTASGNNLVLSPAPLRTAKVNATTALVIPVGTNNQRPQAAVVETGAIRFNTDTQQYEGYNATAASWSSLGGVRDVDGNTYIIAEASVGSNDNTLYFYNNGLNTARLNNTYFDFRSTKRIRSENMSAPSYTEWRANTPVSVGQYLKHKNNIYEVTIAGTTAGSANPPIHTTGIAINGSATLLWSALSISTLTFEEISEVRIGPDGTTPLVISDELVLQNNQISSKLNDINIKPSVGKKVFVDSNSSLVLPVGDNNQRGAAVIGSVRFNTSISQYEGYDGSNWSSLGGVRDVDGNTYIIPETSAGSNENILYFYNDDNNTLQLSSGGLDFVSTDNITSSTTDTLNLNASVVNFDNLSLSIDNTGTSTILSSIKDSLDINLSVGLNVDNLLSLTSNGEISVNTGFALGSESKINILDSTLKYFELSDSIISTFVIDLEKNVVDTGSDIIYDPSVHRAARMTIIVDNTTKDEREVIDFNICHKGTDIFYTEYGNITTSVKLIQTSFDFTAGNEVRATFTANQNNSANDIINIVVHKTIIKK
ncbi:virion structural protein [Synechococcus phage S-PM2]|uniref:Virion structural protein n=1 Tax=Synechococcus phage S-PM2 TaxID=238854 RepID=Q5GQW7_BPSYP|nr:virion structural protein [Synechococcus phage S-PM2]CAF34150.1 virion structural protein [Synechococcus phage S-PM2]CFW42220.1 virion structural protein [Synechococcus phage S-PM2]